MGLRGEGVSRQQPRGLCVEVLSEEGIQVRGPQEVKSPPWQQSPTELGAPGARHTRSSDSPTAHSLGWRRFIETDVLLLCPDFPGLLLQETPEWEVSQMH